MKVLIINEEKKVFEGSADFLEAPGVAGEIGIMPAHAKMLAPLKSGQIIIKNAEAEPLSFDINGGFVKVDSDKIDILTSSLSERKNDEVN